MKLELGIIFSLIFVVSIGVSAYAEHTDEVKLKKIDALENRIAYSEYNKAIVEEVVANHANFTSNGFGLYTEDSDYFQNMKARAISMLEYVNNNIANHTSNLEEYRNDNKLTGNYFAFPLSAPKNLIYTNTHNSITLNWKIEDDRVTGYHIGCFNIDKGDNDIIHLNGTKRDRCDTTSNSGDTNFTVTGLTPNEKYILYIWAIHDEEIKSRTSNAVTVITDHKLTTQQSIAHEIINEYITLDIPEKPTNLVYTVDENSIVLSWDESNDDTITGYEILCKERGTRHLSVCYTSDTVDNAFTIPNNDGKYVYRVVAVNDLGNSERSNFVRVNWN